MYGVIIGGSYAIGGSYTGLTAALRLVPALRNMK